MISLFQVLDSGTRATIFGVDRGWNSKSQDVVHIEISSELF